MKKSLGEQLRTLVGSFGGRNCIVVLLFLIRKKNGKSSRLENRFWAKLNDNRRVYGEGPNYQVWERENLRFRRFSKRLISTRLQIKTNWN